MILVVGMPSGGTSLTAGILHHLGVDMGDIGPYEMDHRPYEKFECRKLLKGLQHLGPYPTLEEIAETFKTYCGGRSGLWGVKNFSIHWLSIKPQLLEGLDITTVWAQRNVEHTLVADIKRRGANLERAGDMGRAHLLMRMMLYLYPPKATLNFHDALLDPEKATKRLARDLGIAWRSEAAEFIDPKGKGNVPGNDQAPSQAEPD